MSEIKRKDRPGDQPMPGDGIGPSMHDLVGSELRENFGATGRLIAEDLQQRKQLGLERYGKLLRAHNGRDTSLDLYEELQDAAVYARQLVTEGGDTRVIFVYHSLLDLLVNIRRLRDERS